MRGPNFILQDVNSDTYRRHSFLKHSSTDPLVSLDWAIFKLSSGQYDYSRSFLKLSFVQRRRPASISWRFAHPEVRVFTLSRRVCKHISFKLPQSQSRPKQCSSASPTAPTSLILLQECSVLRADHGILIWSKVAWMEIHTG